MDFDLISDLHIDQWSTELNFKGMGTSLTCIVAGDVSQDLLITKNFLYQLCDHYKQVLFVDGNHEHKANYGNITQNCEWMERELNKKRNLTYLYDSTCIFGNTAIVGTNGWWSFDYCEPNISRLDQIDEFCEEENYPQSVAVKIWDEAVENSEFLYNVVSDLNRTNAIEEIVIITHTVPKKELIDPINQFSLNGLTKLYNSHMEEVAGADIHKKISTWCFGHYHNIAWDRTIDGIRYVSHPRGLPGDSLFPVYYPKLIKL